MNGALASSKSSGSPCTHRNRPSGVVEPIKPNPRVEADISALNLNAPQLQRGRREVLDQIRKRLDSADYSISALKKLLHDHRISSGTITPEYAECVRYFVLKKLRIRGETPASP
jgi:hypothetical protein